MAHTYTCSDILYTDADITSWICINLHLRLCHRSIAMQVWGGGGLGDIPTSQIMSQILSNAGGGKVVVVVLAIYLHLRLYHISIAMQVGEGGGGGVGDIPTS